MTILEEYLKSEVGLDPMQIELLASFFTEETLKNGEFLVRQGSYCKKMVIIKEGYLRCYFSTEKKDITHWVFWKGHTVTDLSSFLLKAPAKWSYQAINDCQVYSIAYTNYQKVCEHFPNWDKYEKGLFIKLVSSLENRIYALLSMTSEERYNFLFKTHPELFNQIPLTYIASMLNMTPETLSRIRRKSIS